MRLLGQVLCVGLFFVCMEDIAHALPAFARREKTSCVMCHTNGSAPHLTPYGYLYRRAGFRAPYNMGNKEVDEQALSPANHFVAGVNVDYEYVNNTPPGSTKGVMTSNQINVPEVEVWPIVGAFFGNFATWSEIDLAPSVNGGGSVDISQADLRYAVGNADFFFNFRGGLMAPEGFGASDQWLDDGNISLIDQLTPQLNQDTLEAPFGAMELPQLGFEFGLNYGDSHLTFGIYNGFVGFINGTTAVTSPTAALMRQNFGLSKDYKLQLDQFVGDIGAITAAFYKGAIPLLDPSGTSFTWLNDFSQERLYLTAFLIPQKLDLLMGAALAQNHFVTSGVEPAGSFTSDGYFVGGMWYVMPHLTLAVRADYFKFNTFKGLADQANGYSIQASLPFENNIFVFRFNNTTSNLASNGVSRGNTTDFRGEWRFLF